TVISNSRNNSLNTLPVEIEALSHLGTLDLHSNQFEVYHIPITFPHLVGFQHILRWLEGFGCEDLQFRDSLTLSLGNLLMNRDGANVLVRILKIKWMIEVISG
uniref:Uncharacterized protein n=1 Tax=Cucumis melo TaxID=3656 RepID=A0A9I9E746_CUCME